MASFCSKEISGMHCASRGLSLLFRIEKTEYLPVLKTSTKFESALQQLATGNCTNALRELLQFHWQCFGNATAQDCDIYKIYTRLFSGRFVIGQIDTGKLWICPYTILHCLLLHGEPHAYGKVPCCSPHLQIYSTHCYTGSNVVQLSIHKKRIVALTQSMQYLISIPV